MSFVFVSHASEDKKSKKIKPIVDALIRNNIKVWLDSPHLLGYTPQEIESSFHRIHANDRWRRYIDDAKRQSCCILVCWSVHAIKPNALAKKSVWFAEADYGRTENKLVACALDDVEIGKIPNGFNDHHMYVVNTKAPDSTVLNLLIGDVKAKMLERGGEKINILQQSTADSDNEFKPYLSDRYYQEDQIVQNALKKGTIKTQKAFFIMAPENECLDEFFRRINEYSFAKDAYSHVNWSQIKVNWRKEWTAAGFYDAYRNAIAQELGELPENVSQSLSVKGPVGVISRLGAAEWHQDECDKLKHWLKFWDNAIKTHSGLKHVIPIIGVKLAHAKAGWENCPEGRALGASFSNKVILNSARNIASSYSGNIELEVLPVLPPIKHSDVQEWNAEYFVPGTLRYKKIQKHANKVFQTAGLLSTLFGEKCRATYGVPQDTFADEFKPLCKSA